MTVLDMPSKEELADIVILHSCTRNCMGVENNAVGCCTLYDRDYIIGPIPDSNKLLERYRETVNPEATHEELFVDFEEGKTLFPERESWQTPKNFPAIRVDMESTSHRCQYLGDDNLCTIHEIRSETCRKFSCGHVKDLLAQMSL